MSSEKKLWALSEDGKIEFTSLNKRYLNEAMQLIRTCFYSQENICRATGLAKNPEAMKELDEMGLNIAKQGISVIAIDKDTSEVVGVLLNKIQHKTTSTKQLLRSYLKNSKCAESKAIFEVLIELDDGVDPLTPYGADCLIELAWLSVSPKFFRRGIAFTLCQISVNLAKKLLKGEDVRTPLEENISLSPLPSPQIVTGLFTTFKTQQIGRRLKFDILKTVECKELHCNGHSFASILGENIVFTIEAKCLM